MATHWLNKSMYPFTSNYMDINGHKLHYIDEGKGETLLFVHGTPSWSFDFRNLIIPLKNKYRCIAIDHIGFGLSDKPEHYDYSTQNHSKSLEQVVLKLQLTNITLVVHDFGGPIGLNVALHYPHLIKRIVVFNSWLWSSANDPQFIKFSKMLRSPLLPFLYRYLNFSPRFVLPTTFGSHKPSKAVLAHYTKPFAHKTQRNGALAFARSLLHDQDWFEQLWEKRAALTQKPTLFIWGLKDPVIIPAYLAKFQAGFTNSRTLLLEECGHFPQEEQPESVVNSLLDFLACT